ncbi:hypothetical protein, partial [Streptomyces sp. NPDC058678]|uniref:hypothetical protein n=1 Tax=Streptomyces sp. NPDC058678 TaxID=3346595 RepID=UPI00364A67E8
RTVCGASAVACQGVSAVGLVVGAPGSIPQAARQAGEELDRRAWTAGPGPQGLDGSALEDQCRRAHR